MDDDTGCAACWLTDGGTDGDADGISDGDGASDGDNCSPTGRDADYDFDKVGESALSLVDIILSVSSKFVTISVDLI